MKKVFGEYYLGFDIGTDSVGWAVTDEQYKVLKMNGKSMWGIHLFESGETAADRRIFRSSRRRLARRSERMTLLKSLFEKEIMKIDPDFYERLEDSKFLEIDKMQKQKNTLFHDKDYDDKKYHKEYPTIYHLRSELIQNKEKHDVRLVYLAVHHILKHRGHFLFEGQDFATVTSFEHVFTQLQEVLNDYSIEFDYTSAADVEDVLKNKSMRLLEKKKNLKLLMMADTKQKSSITDLLAGAKVTLATVFDDESLKEEEITSISFSEGIEEIEDKLLDILGDRMFVIQKLKAVFDWSLLVHILKGESYISEAKKIVYEEHKSDLALLKELIHKYLSTKNKKEILSAVDVVGNYVSYVGQEDVKSCSQKDFCDFIVKKLKNVEINNENELKFLEKCRDGKAFPKQVVKENGIIPYQLHYAELKKILENAERYIPFLLEKDIDGISISDKIRSMMTFRIPYYVGPLNAHSNHAWIKKISNEKIYPWNFEKVVDMEASANAFILRMTNKCTYLPSADVLPKQSVLYCKYNILNQLNNIRVNGDKLTISVKQELFQDLFLNVPKAKKVTFKQLQKYLIAKGYYSSADNIEITGLDGEVVGDMKSYLVFKNILGNHMLSIEEIDSIITKIVILGESKNLLKDDISKKYSSVLSGEQIDKICKLNFAGWGRFSKEFLTKIYHIDEATGEGINIINMMYESECNLMQLLSNQYQYIDAIEEYNEEHSKQFKGLNTKILDDLYVSPAVKRSIWRVLMLTKEIVKVTGHEPTKIFVEMARDTQENGKKGNRTLSRKKQLQELYAACKLDERELIESLEGVDEGNLRDNMLYLYYTQMGRCMYSGERIDLQEIIRGSKIYDIDHIYPRSKVKDDSIQANKVLVKRTLNADKGDEYPIPSKCLSPKVHELWSMLYSKKLISKEKYSRLSRRTGFTEDELSGFIARQIVETRQSSKAVADLFKKLYPNSNVVYVKAGNVSEFRHKYGIVKSRLVNDYHHAKDAYLNIVVGNVFDEKFTKNPLHFIKSNQIYSMNKVFDYPVMKGDKVVWESTNASSLKIVKEQVNKNNILFTRYATENKAGFYDQNPVKKGKGQYPLKSSDKRLANIEQYGGYNSLGGAYFFLVEHTNKKKRIRTIEYVTVVSAKDIHDEIELKKYAEEYLELKEVKILISKIKFNALIKVNGLRMHISGRTGNQIIVKLAMPLVISNKFYHYSKRIEKYINKNREEKTILPITSFQKITKEENCELYDEMTKKLKSSIYRKMPSCQLELLEKSREKFFGLSTFEQCQVLYNIITLLNTVASTCDLTLIGGSKNAGKLLIGKNIMNLEEALLINQSVTGMFEQVIDLKSL